jgi:hypothetical protein
MASDLFTPDQEETILRHPITKFVDFCRDDLPKDSFDQGVDEGTYCELDVGHI